MFGSRRDGDCKKIAALAKALLDGKEKLHDLIGEASGWLAEKLGGRRERDFIRQLERLTGKKVTLASTTAA